MKRLRGQHNCYDPKVGEPSHAWDVNKKERGARDVVWRCSAHQSWTRDGGDKERDGVSYWTSDDPKD
jgi:hypothetical protein